MLNSRHVLRNWLYATNGENCDLNRMLNFWKVEKNGESQSRGRRVPLPGWRPGLLVTCGVLGVQSGAFSLLGPKSQWVWMGRVPWRPVTATGKTSAPKGLPPGPETSISAHGLAASPGRFFFNAPILGLHPSLWAQHILPAWASGK